jgi:hypothetical protein
VRPLFYDTMHTNNQGMALIAGALAAALEEHGLLGPSIPAQATTAASSER